MKRITLCGSTKFKREFEAINKQLSLEGHIVYSCSFYAQADNVELSEEQKKTLDDVHKKKIDNSDGIFVIDVDGYIGESTHSEIRYAIDNGKFVKYLSSFPDLKLLCDATLPGLNNYGSVKESEELRTKFLHLIHQVNHCEMQSEKIKLSNEILKIFEAEILKIMKLRRDLFAMKSINDQFVMNIESLIGQLDKSREISNDCIDLFFKRFSNEETAIEFGKIMSKYHDKHIS